MGENHFQKLRTALYGFVLFMASIAWFILIKVLQSTHTRETILHKSYKNKSKDILSILAYGFASIISFWEPVYSVIIYVMIAIIWFVPNKDLE